MTMTQRPEMLPDGWKTAAIGYRISSHMEKKREEGAALALALAEQAIGELKMPTQVKLAVVRARC